MILAAAQSASVAGDIRKNVAHHLRFARVAAGHGVQLLVFPELSLTGYELSLAAANALDPESALLDPIREESQRAGMTIVAGAPLLGEDALHIGAVVFRPDGSVSCYRKVHVHSSERGVFQPGPGGADLSVDGVWVGLAICADASHEEHAAEAAVRGVRLYAVGAMIDESAYARKAGLLKGYARRHGMAVLLANYSGMTGGEVAAGRSAIWPDDGGPAIGIEGREEALVVGRKEDGGWSGCVVKLGVW